MQDKTTIARPYAQAVFETASEESKLTEWSDMLGLLEAVVTDPQMKAVLTNPKLDTQALTDLVLGDKTGEEQVSEHREPLFTVFADHDLTDALDRF